MAVLLFLAALGLTLYPVISSAYIEQHRSEIRTAYEEQIEQAGDGRLDKIREQAMVYNRAIVPGTSAESYTQSALLAASNGYDSLLNPTGDGVMGYVEIPKIGVNLPIYHGTGSDSLERGVGHLLGSSLPVGGESTHTVLTGHSGMASQKLFSDLTQLESGDIFYIHILGEVLAYQVDNISTVLPYDTSLLGIYKGEDYCTLVTCTPYGVNSHRLLVRGTRIHCEQTEKTDTNTTESDQPISEWEEQYFLGLCLGVLAVLIIADVILLAILSHRPCRRKKVPRKRDI